MLIPGTVELSIEELRAAAIHGVNRSIAAIDMGAAGRYGADDRDRSPWGISVEGAIGELALAKWTGRYWAGLSGFREHAHDVEGVEVRYTWRDGGALILHKGDVDAPFVLVTGGRLVGLELARRRFVVTLRGWIDAADGKHDRFWREDRPCPAFFVPQGHLHPIGTLLPELARRARIADSDDTPRRANEIEW